MVVSSSQPSAALTALLRCPAPGHEVGHEVVRRGEALECAAGCPVRWPLEEGILRAFVPHEAIEGDVTDHIKQFYEATPFPNYDDLDDVGTLIERSFDRGFPELLNRAIPFGATVLEVGCGTGQLGNFLAVGGRTVLSADLCLSSLRLGQAFKQRNGLTGVTFAQMNLFRLPVRPAAFDVVICTGVLHHTAAPREGFRGLVPLVRPGGHLIVGLYNRYGRFKNRVRARLFRVLGERFARLDPYLRQHAVTGDKAHAWFMDQYKNPHESLHTIDEVLGWFDEEGLEFVRGLPSTVFGGAAELDGSATLFDPEPRASRTDRLLSQLRELVHDVDGGLFVMIGRRPR